MARVAFPTTTSTVGGRTGGGVCVTALGKMLISAYEEADQYHRDYSSTDLKTLAGMLSAESRPAMNKPAIRPVNPVRRARPRPRII